MRRELNYNGKVYKSLKKLCDDTGISYSGLSVYIYRDKGKHLNDIQDDEEVIEYILEYNKLKEEGMRRGNWRVKGGILLDGKLYPSFNDIYENTKITLQGFSRYCIRTTGKAPVDLSDSMLVQMLNKYYDIVKGGNKIKVDVKIGYKGKVYTSVKEACTKARVNNIKFERYCMDMYGVMPRYLGNVLSDVFTDFVNSEKEKRYVRLQSLYGDKTKDVVKRAKVKNMNVCYDGVMYDNIEDACAELTGSKTQYSAFSSYCYDELGITFSKIYEENIRSAIFAEYIDRKSTLHRGLEVVYNGVTYKTIKSACADAGVSEAGFYAYCITKYKNNAKVMSRDELSKAFEEYMDRYVGKVGYALLYEGKDYTSAMDACIDVGVSYSSFRNFCRRISGKDICDLSPVERGALLEEYVKSKGISYKGKVYKNVKRMCESEGVSHSGFIRYCKKVYGNTPAKMDSCFLENTLIDYMGLKSNNTSPCAITYKGKNYSSTLCACKEVGITRTSFTSFCCRVTGKVFHELSVEERSKLFETYAREKGKF